MSDDEGKGVDRTAEIEDAMEDISTEIGAPSWLDPNFGKEPVSVAEKAEPSGKIELSPLMETVATQGPPPEVETPFPLADKGSAPPSTGAESIAGAPWSDMPAPSAPPLRAGVGTTVDLEALAGEQHAPDTSEAARLQAIQAKAEAERIKRETEARAKADKLRFDAEQRELKRKEQARNLKRERSSVLGDMHAEIYGRFKS